ncbi:copper resistance CopC/CopD family protein [Myceligenerans indicum]|uniref:Copper resistance protein CopC n=1 Tax=Myceligenerans indicum TaxID=2593663 RepID=A0ABS1LM09_9MICO|nr:CopD family protein [Myceligenerans indicum]MBL0886818.1 hypothetical protein [Myceligenerans indicum]
MTRATPAVRPAHLPAARDGAAGAPRWLAAVAVALIALLLGAPPAAAHTELVSTDPADGATHDGPLAALTLTYTLPVTPLGDAVVLTGPDGDVPAEVTQQQDGAVVVATPEEPLTDGEYSAAWSVAAQDGHPLQGTLTFTVTGAPPAAEPEEDASAEPQDPEPTGAAGDEDAGADADAGTAHEDATEPSGPDDGSAHQAGSATSTIAGLLARLGNAAALWGLLVAAGGLIFAPTVLRGSDRVDVPAALTVVRWTGILILAGLAVRLVARTVVIAQGDLSAVVSPDAYGYALAGPTRWVFVLQAAGAVAVLAGVGRTLAGSWLAITGTALAGTGHVMDGHSFTGAVPWLVITTDVAHLAAASAWVGGLVMTAVVLRRRRKDGRMLDAGLLGARFSVVAGVSVVVLGFAGIVLAVAVLDHPAQLWQTTWGLLLLAKVGLVAVVGLVGAYSHFRLVPHLERPGRTARSAHRAASRMERTAGLETGLMVAVVLVTAWLVSASVHG